MTSKKPYHLLRAHICFILIMTIILVYNSVKLASIDVQVEQLTENQSLILDTITTDYTTIDELAELQLYDDIQINCIALALYGEARGETAEGMIGVAYVIMNRTLSSPNRFGSTPCEVITQRYQFESINGALQSMVHSTIEGDIMFPHMHNEWLSNRIKEIARDVYYFQIPDPTNYATHFWAPKAQYRLGRKRPMWSITLKRLATLGGHIYHE